MRAGMRCPDCGWPLLKTVDVDHSTRCPATAPYVAEIRRRGRWVWWITLSHGISAFDGGWFALGEKRARKKAQQLCAKYDAQNRRWYATRTEVSADV